MEYIELLGGLIALVFGGKYLVKGGVSIASYFGVSTLVVGLTVVALGTSAPELIVSINAAVTGHPEIAVGNVVGSNISNLALVLAFTAIIIPLPVKKQSLLVDWPVMMLASILFFIFILNNYFQFHEGFIFISLLIIYVFFLIRQSRKTGKNDTEYPIKPDYSLLASIICVVISSVVLAFGARFLVDGASTIASSFGISERVISITIVAFGTSVPELATSLVAAAKKETDISLGNIIGSNIFNLFAVMGITGTIKKVEVDSATFSYDIIWMLVFSILVFAFVFPFKKKILQRWAGIVLFSFYVIYVITLF